MANKVCRYSMNGVCVKSSCPQCAKTCVCNLVGLGICKYEELIDDVKTYTPVECLKKAMQNNGYHIDDISDYDAENAIKQFLELMRASGHLEATEADKPVEFKEGDEVRISDIDGHPFWEEYDKGREWITYITLDEKLIVTFNDTRTTAIIHKTVNNS